MRHNSRYCRLLPAPEPGRFARAIVPVACYALGALAWAVALYAAAFIFAVVN